MGAQHEAWWLQPLRCPIAIVIPEGYIAEFRFKQQRFAISTLLVDQRACFQLQRQAEPAEFPSMPPAAAADHSGHPSRSRSCN